jgi:hypothetical protein
VPTKAKKKATKKDKSARKVVTIRDLGSEDWWRLAKVYRELLPQLGKLTRKTLTDARESGELYCVRLFNSGQYKPVRAKFWQSLSWSEKLCFDKPNKYDPDVYVRRPWEVLPVPAPQATEQNKADASKSSRGKPEPRPNKDWKWVLAYKLCELHKANTSLTAEQLAEHCQKELDGYAPDESAINLLRSDLRRLLD